MDFEIQLLIIFIVIFVIVMIGYLIVSSAEEREKREWELELIRSLANNTAEITPDQFFNIRNRHPKSDFTGVYILHNRTKEKYYVGQGKSVYKRVNAHFTGHGNGDVYADYKYGDHFTIKMVSLASSGINTLDELERKMIDAYNAYSNGYNKTRGNSGY